MRREVLRAFRPPPNTLQPLWAAFGDEVLTDAAATLAAIGAALAAFETEDARFAPFSSKYDHWSRASAQLTDAEQRGLRF